MVASHGTGEVGRIGRAYDFKRADVRRQELSDWNTVVSLLRWQGRALSQSKLVGLLLPSVQLCSGRNLDCGLEAYAAVILPKLIFCYYMETTKFKYLFDFQRPY